MKKRNFYIIIVALFSIIILSGCKNSKENIEFEKSLSEISFLENQCITIFNKVVAEEYIKDNQVDWNLLKEDYVVLYNSIDVIMIDLASIQIPSQSIVELENRFSDLNVCVENQDLNMFASRICDIYDFITNSILSNISKNEVLKQEKRAKGELLYVGYNLMISNKEEATIRIDEFQKQFSELSKSKDYLENNSYKINRIFIDIQRLKSLIENDKFDIGKGLFFEILEQYT